MTEEKEEEKWESEGEIVYVVEWYGETITSFQGLPIVQFLITCSMQKQRGRAGPFYHVNDVSVDLGRRRWGEVPDQKNEVEAISVLITGVLSIRKVKNILLLVLSKECLRENGSVCDQELDGGKAWEQG